MKKAFKITFPIYTSRGYGCGIYIELILVENKALKRAHSWLHNCFSNAVIGKNQLLEICNRDCAKYIKATHKVVIYSGLVSQCFGRLLLLHNRHSLDPCSSKNFSFA